MFPSKKATTRGDELLNPAEAKAYLNELGAQDV